MGECAERNLLDSGDPMTFIYQIVCTRGKPLSRGADRNMKGTLSPVEFPQFISGRATHSPEYLYLFFMSNPPWRRSIAASVGSAAVSRNRFKEDGVRRL